MPLRDADPAIVIGVVLGDLEPADILPLKVEMLWEAKPFTSDIVMGLTVTKKDGSTVKLKELLSLKLLTGSNMDPDTVIWRSYHAMARKMSFQLFEVDPRIGLPLDENSAKQFPTSPLFDPPYIKAPYSRYLSDVQERGETLSGEEAEAEHHLKRCPFCEGAIYPYGGSRRLGVWCGGNVGFAHEECAPWVKPRH